MQHETTQAFHQIRNLRVISMSPSARIVLASVGAALDLSPATLSDLLDRRPALVPVPPGQDARRLRGFLMAMGMRVAECSPDAADGIDLCIQPRMDTDIAPLAAALLPILLAVTPQIVTELSDMALRRGLAAPDGLVIAIPAAAVAARLGRRLRRMHQIAVMESVSCEAVYDLFAPPQGVTGLTAHLRLLGYGEDPQTGALAAGLDRHVARHLTRRFPQVRVIDRAFQRLDVMLTGINGPVSADIADFLTSRTGLALDRFDQVSLAMPVRLETGLLRASAVQFRRDYAAIGLQTHLTLSHPFSAA